MNTIKIGNFIIGENHKPFIIAEMSGNHNQSLERALAIVDAAAGAGAHAIKLQTYTADTITMDIGYIINEENSLWKGKNLYQLYKEAYTPWEWHKPIFERAKQKGLIAFSSPFDETAVEFLESLDVPAYKIASFENTHWPLLKKVAATGKPVIMSTGVSDVSDIDESVRILRHASSKDIILLKCTSTYPASPENTNLLTIPHLAQLFNCTVGLSDHTMGIGASVAAVALGARVIEKHFTLRRADGGVDSAFSLEPEELKALVVESERAFLALGHIQYGIQKAEEKSKFYKRSIYIARDIQVGEPFTKENVRVIRPGDGLAPKYYELILGKIAKTDLKAGTPLNWGKNYLGIFASMAIMLSIADKGMSEEQLIKLSGDGDLKRLEVYKYWPSEVYGMGRYIREYGFYPTHLPLYIMTDHSPTLREDISFDLKFNAPVQFYHSPYLVSKWKNVSNKPVYVLPSPFVFYRKKSKVYQAPNAKGTLVFPTHNSHHLKDKSDIEAYIQQLLELPEEFQPISACIYFLDVLDGKHKIFQKYNIPVYTAGNWLDYKFVERFYTILMNFKYTTSNLPGSYLFYSVEMGIPFSLFGNKPFYINESDRSIPLGDYSNAWKQPRVQQAVNLFTGIHKEITKEQKDFVETNLGLKHGISRLQMSKVLYSTYIKSDPYFKSGTPGKIKNSLFKLYSLIG